MYLERDDGSVDALPCAEVAVNREDVQVMDRVDACVVFGGGGGGGSSSAPSRQRVEGNKVGEAAVPVELDEPAYVFETGGLVRAVERGVLRRIGRGSRSPRPSVAAAAADALRVGRGVERVGALDQLVDVDPDAVDARMAEKVRHVAIREPDRAKGLDQTRHPVF